MWWSRPYESAVNSSSENWNKEKLWTVLLMSLLNFSLLLWLICCYLCRLNSFLSCLLPLFFNQLSTTTHIWWTTVFKIIKLKLLVNSTHIFFISFLSLYFSECLFSSSVSMTNNETYPLSLCVPFFTEIFTFTNVGIKRSFLQVLIYFM